MTMTTEININELVVDQVFTCPLAVLEVDPDQPRKTKPIDEIMGIGNSIVERGQDNPIHVRKHPTKPDRLMIVAGECRFQAHLNNETLRKNGTIKAVLKAYATDEEVHLAQIAENDARSNLHPMEQARSWHKQINHYGTSLEKTAAAAGKAVAYVRQSIRLCELPEDIQKAVNDGTCPKEVAFFILDTLPDCPEQAWKHASRCKGVKNMKAAVTALKEQKSKQVIPGLEVQESNQPQPVKVKDALKVFDLWTKAHSEFSGSPFSNGSCLAFVQMINKNKKQEGGVALLEAQAKQIIKDMNHVLESIALFHAQSGTNKTA